LSCRTRGDEYEGRGRVEPAEAFKHFHVPELRLVTRGKEAEVRYLVSLLLVDGFLQDFTLPEKQDEVQHRDLSWNFGVKKLI